MVLVLLTAHATRFLHAEFFSHSFFFLEKLRLKAQAFLLSFKGLTQLKNFFLFELGLGSAQLENHKSELGLGLNSE